jgi:hypothetical protein
MSEELVLGIIAGLGLLGGVGLGIKAIIERAVLKARAGVDDASATEVVTRAARELIDPLRKELATERAEHAEELAEQRREKQELREAHRQQVEDERKAAAEAARRAEAIQKQLAEVSEEVTHLRAALAETQAQCDTWKQKYEQEAAKNQPT